MLCFQYTKMHKEPQSDCLTYRSMFSAKSYTTTRKIKQSDVVSVELIYGERPLEWHRLETLRLSPYHCYLYTVPVLTLQRTESQAECLHESHVTLQTDTPFPPHTNPSGFYTFSLCLDTALCSSPSVFVRSLLQLARLVSCLCQPSNRPISWEGCDPPCRYLLPCGLFKKRQKTS